MTEQRFRAERLVAASGVLTDAVLVVADGRITAIEVGAPRRDDGVLAGWVVPGFVDTHCHGGGGADYASTDPDEVLRARDFHRRHGTTTTVASLVTTELDHLLAQLATLVPLVHRGELAGVHLEGPFLSPAKRGAHDPQWLREPEPAVVDRLLEVGDGALTMVTLAPELPGAMAALDRFVAAGVTVAVGHTDGDETTTKAALDRGATAATHLFNAMRPVHHREPGPVPALLDDPRVMVELIADGFHLHGDVVAMAVAAAGPQRVALVTDAMLATGMPDGAYRLGSLDVSVESGMARLVDAEGTPGSIAGSTLTMARAFAFLVGLGVPVPDVAAMAAGTPARHHRIATDGRPAGVLEVGGPADLCVVDGSGVLQRVMKRGTWVDRP